MADGIHNITGTWTKEGDFIPADGSPILYHDPNPQEPEPEPFTAEQERRIQEMIAEATRELESKVQRLAQRAGEDTESWRF